MSDDEIQVVLGGPYREAFEEWLRGAGFELFAIPASEDDLPTFGVRVQAAFRG